MAFNVNDVAAYICEVRGTMTAMTLEKLAYYSQAWSLVWDERPLFDARIEAWANGPVIPELYNKHRGVYSIDKWVDGDSSNLDEKAKETVEAVVDHYGNKTAQELSERTHLEAPWINARKGLPDVERGSEEITNAAMHEYYSGL